MSPRILPFLALASVTMLAAPSAVLADSADELDRAYQKLRESSYRKREIPMGIAAAGGSAASVTEYVGDRSRLIVETDMPSIGRVQQERVTIGGRSAVRTLAPGVVAQVDQAKRRQRGAAARALLGQVASVGTNVAMFGGGKADVVRSAVGAAVIVKSVADANATFNETSAAFDSSWRLVPADDSTYAPATDAWRGAEIERSTSRKTVVYKCRPTDGTDALTIIKVNAKTGVPASEEIYVSGQQVARVVYFDVGAPITIDVPDCLKS